MRGVASAAILGCFILQSTACAGALEQDSAQKHRPTSFLGQGRRLGPSASLRPPLAAGVADPQLRSLPFLSHDLALFERLIRVGQGEALTAQEFGEENASFWHNVGFELSQQGSVTRQVDLLTPSTDLVYSLDPRLKNIDCFAIIAVDRKGSTEPYIYGTLRSLFRSVHVPIEVNVLLSNADADFVSPARLEEILGVDNAAHVHVLPAEATAADFINARLPPGRRGGWNYTRALSAYAGERGLLLMEDDIVLALGGIEAVDWQLTTQPLDVLSLFNFHCERISPNFDFSDAPMMFQPMPSDWHFYCSQAIFYRPYLTAAISRYVQLRMHRENHDNLIGDFFRDYDLTFGYTVPSLVQHVGRSSAYGSTLFLDSPCFRPDLSF